MIRSSAIRLPVPRLTLTLLCLALIGSGSALAANPSFLTGPQKGDAFDLAWAYIESQRAELGLTAADLEDVTVRDRYVSQHNGVTHLYLQQRLGGIEVFNGQININVASDGSIINMGNGFISDLAAKANVGAPELSDRQAIERAAAHFGLSAADDLVLLSDDGGLERRANFTGESISSMEIPVRLVYQPMEDGRVRLAWETRLDTPGDADTWNVRIDAVTGDVVGQFNHTSYDSYRVVPFPPFSDPEDSGGQSVVVDPADLGVIDASPFGWHDTDGVPGAESTLTRGNNVNAQDDIDNNNTGGFSPDGGPSLDFDFVFDPDDTPTGGTNLEAAIVNLFYGNNVMHDLVYQYGFDEASGNFQVTNYTGMGLGNDVVEADAQDGSGTNNANFRTFAEGVPGSRMQMFIWTNPFGERVTVNPGSSVAGEYIANPSVNGGTANGLTADVAIVDDGVDPPNDGCEAVATDLTGKIGLILWNQGACNSSVFVANAAAAGAIAVIIIDNNEQPFTNFGGSPMIPSVAVGLSDGQAIFGAIDGGETVNATIDTNPNAAPNRDSDFDNGIVAHEYGHGISIRLTGGPSSVGCLGGSEQAGEGWSDFWTLLLSAKETDTPEMIKGVGNYVTYRPVNGEGIRNFPYTTDMKLNPQTYEDIGDTNVPHGVGEIWMAMVWEVYWEMVNKWGFDTDFYNGTGGNNRTIQLVLDGMKLQPCLPDFVEARDAILMADEVNYNGVDTCSIWRAFAKRGLGVNADPGVAGGGVGVGDEVEDFTFPPECAPDLFADGFESGDTVAWSSTQP